MFYNLYDINACKYKKTRFGVILCILVHHFVPMNNPLQQKKCSQQILLYSTISKICSTPEIHIILISSLIL